ncbi:MAG: hypothetical protein WA988_12925 [Candidatus Nanopelagicales bacterium]
MPNRTSHQLVVGLLMLATGIAAVAIASTRFSPWMMPIAALLPIPGGAITMICVVKLRIAHDLDRADCASS